MVDVLVIYRWAKSDVSSSDPVSLAASPEYAYMSGPAAGGASQTRF